MLTALIPLSITSLHTPGADSLCRKSLYTRHVLGSLDCTLRPTMIHLKSKINTIMCFAGNLKMVMASRDVSNRFPTSLPIDTKSQKLDDDRHPQMQR
jgi:hypothetical protein